MPLERDGDLVKQTREILGFVARRHDHGQERLERMHGLFRQGGACFGSQEMVSDTTVSGR